MNDKKQSSELGNWKKLGRRWLTILSVGLLSNLCLIVLGLAGVGDSKSVAKDHAIDAQVDVAIVGNQNSATDSAMVSSTVEQVPSRESTETIAAKAESGSSVAAANISTLPSDQPANESAPRADVATATPNQPLPNDEVTTPKVTSQDAAIPAVLIENAVEAIEIEAAATVIFNPATTGGIVHFVVDNEIYSLSPAEYRCFPGAEKKRVVFHKGDDLIDVEQEVTTGAFAFGVDESGWKLKFVNTITSQRLLSTCRLVPQKD